MQKKREQFISCHANDNHQYRKYFTTRRQVMELFVYFFYLYDFAFIQNLCKFRTPMLSCTSIECDMFKQVPITRDLIAKVRVRGLSNWNREDCAQFKGRLYRKEDSFIAVRSSICLSTSKTEM